MRPGTRFINQDPDDAVSGEVVKITMKCGAEGVLVAKQNYGEIAELLIRPDGGGPLRTFKVRTPIIPSKKVLH